jgi:hypothetical protein
MLKAPEFVSERLKKRENPGFGQVVGLTGQSLPIFMASRARALR